MPAKKTNKNENGILTVAGGVRLFGVVLLSILLFGCGGKNQANAQNSVKEASNDAVVFSPQDYRQRLKTIDEERAALTGKYRSDTRNAATIENARRAFVDSIYKSVIPFWYETEWDFYGMTETPQTGKIACGYFVTTVLRDAGLRVERAKLAQQASEKIILSLTSESYIKRFRNAPLADFVGAIENWGEGVYIVGLDFHVGFIVNDGAKTYFIHSSYIEPQRVVKELAAASKVLASSKYRVVGKISADDELLAKWLLQKNIPTK